MDLEFRNPLLISTSITSVSLICELTSNSDDLTGNLCVLLMFTLEFFYILRLIDEKLISTFGLCKVSKEPSSLSVGTEFRRT